MTGMDREEPRKIEVPKRGRNGMLKCETKLGKGSIKLCLFLAMSIAALCSSLFTIYSCSFFSYKEVDVFNDSYASNADITYEPFEYLPSAGVGLFSYYMGDPTGKGVMTNDQMCFYYGDDFADYHWFSSNNEGTGIVDKWVLARICSIMAPIFAVLALFQAVAENMLKCKISYCGDGKYLKTQLLLIAAFFQIGTFMVILAPPIMSSSSEEDQKQQFCFSETSNLDCKMDTGSIFSLSSVVIYIVLAQASFCTPRPSMVEVDLAKQDENERIDDNDGGERDTDESDDSSISDLSESQYSRGGHSKPAPKKLLEPEDDDEASVFSTLIQYFGRNHKSEDMEDPRDMESEFNSIVEHSMQQKRIGYSRRDS